MLYKHSSHKDISRSQHSQRQGLQKMPLQCYRLVSPSEYAFQSEELFFHNQYIKSRTHLGAYVDEQQTYKKEGVDLFLNTVEHDMTSVEMDKKTEQPCSTKDLPLLKVANSGLMAIEASPKHKKLFYAHPKLVAKSNSALAQKTDRLRLASEPHYKVSVPDLEGEMHELWAVFASYDGEKASSIGSTSDCKHFANEIIGNTSTPTGCVIMGSTDSRKVFPFIPTESSKFSELLSVLLTYQSSLSPHSVYHELENYENFTIYPEALVSVQSGPPQYNPEICDGLGVNAHTHPLVGEAFRILGFAPPDDYYHDQDMDEYMEKVRNRSSVYSKYHTACPEQVFIPRQWMESRWNFHYAGVVCQSGRDYVTLENFNRVNEGENTLIAAFNRFLLASEELQEELKTLLESEKLKIPRAGTDRIAFIDRLMHTIVDNGRASEELLHAAKSFQQESNLEILPEDPASLFHFEMYGMESDQSFHDAFEFDTKGNAITHRVAKSLDLQKTALREHLDFLVTRPLDTSATLTFGLPNCDAVLKRMEHMLKQFRDETLLAITRSHTLPLTQKVLDNMDKESDRIFGEMLLSIQKAFYLDMKMPAPDMFSMHLGKILLELDFLSTHAQSKKKSALFESYKDKIHTLYYSFNRCKFLADPSD
ncbi:hypothetical protein [Aureibacter tunicatorum]|uniref:Uncharacterized protein n=1 Tax=Aureibacter tunicatorum TaxID=866807 RepID=A0AAE3XJW5_9BACT|nr:hypothetical protein [Aureibacter tunicatorum]MDR6238247.1 hypothetical protein [Aureibacter tunicatorum]BDD03280.1 hypothetical protein AUTU_07630 [Aureibacter tunicatorum]